MVLHKNFPKGKFQIFDPLIRWFPADEDLRKEMDFRTGGIKLNY